MNEVRPELGRSLEAHEFRAWYWLRDELARFCRTEGLPASGSKQELSARIDAYLSGEPLPLPQKRTRRTSPMPDRFELTFVIGKGWHCSQELRRFFESHCGKGFHFNEALRRFIAAGAGRTLADAVALYMRTTGPQRERAEIGEQFEYNRHLRDYFSAHPNATKEEAVAAWKRKRNERR
jgi:hypothetical protein